MRGVKVITAETTQELEDKLNKTISEICAGVDFDAEYDITTTSSEGKLIATVSYARRYCGDACGLD